MRLKSHIWVSAYLRRLDKAFIAATMTRRGDADAGSIFIKIAHMDGTAQVYAPIPASIITRQLAVPAALTQAFKQTATEEKDNNAAALIEEGRAWQAVYPKRVTEAEADAYLKRHATRDADMWILEVESADGRHLLGDLSLVASA